MPVVGAKLARLSACEDFLPLLPVFQNLSYVNIHAISTPQPRDPINVLALAVLPALRTLRVTGNANSTHTRFLEELTQLDSLILIHTVPFLASEGSALPQSLRSLEMDLWGYQPSVQSKLPCRRTLQQFSGKLQSLSLGNLAGQFNPISQLGALACLQQLKHLSLCFADLSSTVGFSPHAAQAFKFPHLLSLHIVLQDYTRAPRWDFSGCPSLLTLRLDCECAHNKMVDLRNVVSIHAGRLSISFAAHEEDVDFKIDL